MHYKPRWAGVGLYDIFKFGFGILKSGWRMLDDGFAEDFVEIGSFDFEVASRVNFGSKFKKFGNILTGFTTSDEYWSIR